MIKQHDAFSMGMAMVSWIRLYQSGVYWVTFGDWPIVVYLDAVVDDFGNLVAVGKPFSRWRDA